MGVIEPNEVNDDGVVDYYGYDIYEEYGGGSGEGGVIIYLAASEIKEAKEAHQAVNASSLLSYILKHLTFSHGYLGGN